MFIYIHIILYVQQTINVHNLVSNRVGILLNKKGSMRNRAALINQYVHTNRLNIIIVLRFMTFYTTHTHTQYDFFYR